MAKEAKLIFSLNAGELTPYLDARIDQSKYEAGCRIMENMIPLVYGGATRRPGTEFINNAISSVVAEPSRLMAFQFSVDTRYILEFGNQVMRVYKDGALQYTGGNVYELTTPYLTADLFDLKFMHSNDVMYITHGTYEPRILARTGDTSWTLTVTTRKHGPCSDENTTEATTITPSATSGSITLTTSAAVFDTDHAPPGAAATDTSTTGAIFRLTQLSAERAQNESFTGNANGTDLTVYKGDTVDYITRGIWDGLVKVEKSYDGGSTYTEVWNTPSESNNNDKALFTEDLADSVWRTTMTSYSSGTADVRLKARSRLVDRYVQITAVASSTSATATVLDDGSGSHAGLIDTSATWRWAEGAWSEYRGWPNSVAISPEDRLCFGGSASYPLNVWCSKIADYQEFELGDKDNDPLTFTLTGQGQQNEIQWMISKGGLIMGTAGGLHRLSSSAEGDPITPTNVKADVQGTIGSASIGAMVVNDAVLFVQRGGRKVQELMFNFDFAEYEPTDLTVYSEHITDSGVTDWAFQKSHDPILWCVKTDGTIAIMSYDRVHKVFAWADVITETLADQP
jgi:hypothetical protein